MAEGGKRLAAIKNKLMATVEPGISLLELDASAERWLRDTGGEPAFKKVEGYRWATCINVNEGVVHGIPNRYVIKDGDLVSIDIGLYYQNYYTDTSMSIVAGKMTKEQVEFLQVGKMALRKAIEAARVGNYIGHISQAMQKEIEGAGYHPVKGLTGHGIGKSLHIPPNIPCCLLGNLEETPIIEPGQTLAIEVIYTWGKTKLVTEADGWTISTRDGTMAALYEETVAITDNGSLVLTN